MTPDSSTSVRYLPPRVTPIGLAPVDWAQDRWFASFSGLVTEPATSIDLGYGNPSTKQRLIVRTEDLSPGQPPSPQRRTTADELAFSAMHLLVNAVGAGAPPLGTTYARRAIAMMDAEAPRHRHWPPATWEVNGSEIIAHIWEFAGAWVGFGFVDQDRGLIVAGHDISPERLIFHDVVSADGFGFDFTVAHGTDEAAPPAPPTAPAGHGPLALADTHHADQLVLAQVNTDSTGQS